MTITSDASGSGWGGVIHLPKKGVTVKRLLESQGNLSQHVDQGDLALATILQATPEQVRDCRIDAYILTARYAIKMSIQIGFYAVSKAWARVQSNFGGIRGHSVDLMALDTNAQQDLSGQPLPHFTPFPTPESAGVNLFAQSPQTAPAVWDNPYVFPTPQSRGPGPQISAAFPYSVHNHCTRTISKTSLVANPERRVT
ncbi:hypothetical protein QZH41_014655 [Actinostola sp. cb2023]|nr:hypothetical protein QZH41_014655 [Actinostola sp. cb2023]